MTAITNLPDLRPSLLLDFANSGRVDPRIQCTRASAATCFGPDGKLRTVASNVPRIDYDPVTGACKGLLVEEARTNLLTYSEQFDNAAWVKTRSSITPNVIAAPDGTLSADKLVEVTGAINTHNISQGPSVTAGITYVFTIYVKAAERSTLRVQLASSGFGENVAYNFDLSAGTATLVTSGTGSSASITLVGNGWYRCVVVAQATATSNAAVTTFLMSENTINYTGDGTSGLYIWGAQLEKGSFPTSYIPTADSQVTRAADAARMTGASFSDWYRQDEGTFMVAASPYSSTSGTGKTYTALATVNESGAAGLDIRWYNGIASYTVDGTNNQFLGPDVVGSIEAIACGYSASSQSGSVNGASVISSSITNTKVPTSLIVGGGFNHGAVLNGHIRRLTYYPKRLPNEQLQRITA